MEDNEKPANANAQPANARRVRTAVKNYESSSSLANQENAATMKQPFYPELSPSKQPDNHRDKTSTHTPPDRRYDMREAEQSHSYPPHKRG